MARSLTRGLLRPLQVYPNRCCCKAWVMHRSFVFTTVVFDFSPLSTWKSILDCFRHFADFVGKIKGEERKEDVAKYEDEIKRIWEVSVLVDLPNVHPKFFAWNAEVNAAARTIWQASSNQKNNFNANIVIYRLSGCSLQY